MTTLHIGSSTSHSPFRTQTPSTPQPICFTTPTASTPRVLIGLLIVLVGVFSPIMATAQEIWVARYKGPVVGGSDVAYAVAVDGSGNVYVTGFSTGSGTGYDFATIKYNSSGTQQWVDRYNGPGNGNDVPNGPYAIAVDASGNPYVTGQSIGSNGDYDYATIKYYACWPA
jgi:hypothetical protein